MGSIKNLILIGLGASKITMEKLSDLLFQNSEKGGTKEEFVDDFLGTPSRSKKQNKAKTAVTQTVEKQKKKIKED